jgi:hypothetical protein
MKITKNRLKQIIKEELSRVLNENQGETVGQSEWEHLLDNVRNRKHKTWARDWKDRSRESSTEEDIAVVRAWLSSNGYEDSNVFDGKDPSWKNQASDKDFLILGQATSGDFNYHTMRHGDEPINLVFIRSVANNTEPIYAYVRY